MIIYCLLSKNSQVLGEYGITHRDYSIDLLDMLKQQQKNGTRFVVMKDFSCAVMNKQFDGEMYSLVVVVEDKGERDQAFDCLDCTMTAFEEDLKKQKMPKAIQRIGKHMRQAMVEQGYGRRRLTLG